MPEVSFRVQMSISSAEAAHQLKGGKRVQMWAANGLGMYLIVPMQFAYEMKFFIYNGETDTTGNIAEEPTAEKAIQNVMRRLKES